jgi:hypothetical protein
MNPENTVFDEGYDAYFNGLYQSCNPYDPRGRRADEWDLGWLQAQDEDTESDTIEAEYEEAEVMRSHL